MENYKVTKENALASVRQSVSSIFTKEDVLYLIEKIEVGSSRVITTQQINDAIDEVVNWAERRVDNLIDLDSAEFEISYTKQIELTSVEIDVESLRNALEEHFMDFGEDEGIDEDENKEVIEAIANNEL
jgi:hypothetical protein